MNNLSKIAKWALSLFFFGTTLVSRIFDNELATFWHILFSFQGKISACSITIFFVPNISFFLNIVCSIRNWYFKNLMILEQFLFNKFWFSLTNVKKPKAHIDRRLVLFSREQSVQRHFKAYFVKIVVKFSSNQITLFKTSIHLVYSI